MGATTAGPAGRVASMDQFRGYAVAGMFVVNFLAGLAAAPVLLKHHNTYFSLADSVMPAFLFAAGFSFRLSLLRRRDRSGAASAYRHAAGRCLALVLVSLALVGLDASFNSWGQMTAGNVREFVAKLLKAGLWNVLAIIGAAQLLALPVVAARPLTRVLTAVTFVAAHVGLSYSFNYEFVYGRPNWMDGYWGAAGVRAWDGGFFGVLMWSAVLLAGTLAYDIVVGAPGPVAAARRLAGTGAGLMALGYLLLCLSTLYDSPTPPGASPVLPPLGQIGSRAPGSLLAEPPFVVPPLPTDRTPNYWAMDKRAVTPSFTLFGTGFAFAVYGLFVLVCDRWGLGLGLFRMFGQNPLAAYLLHFPVLKAVRALVPKDSPWWWCLVGLVVFLGVTTAFVRYLDRNKYYVRV